MVKAVRANRWVVSGGKLTGADLDQAVAETYANNALSIYRFFRNFKDPIAMQNLVQFPDELRYYLRECQESKRGLLVVGIHLGNFDLVMQALGSQAAEFAEMRKMALGVPNPGRGYEWQNEFRRKNGIDVVPASISSIKLAAEILAGGGLVISGLDRPIPEAKYRPKFFGRPAPVPVLHVPLALKAKVPVLIAGALMKPDNTYQIFLSKPCYMKPFPDRKQEILANAESIIAIAEDYIRFAPEQWSMPYPVWPEALCEVPN
jgi:KDO2-lipid IV(A) lauroyltransferase